MKVNIVTQPLFSNYGGILQNYALQEVLRRMGHEPLTINTPLFPPYSRNIFKDFARTIYNILKKIKGEYNYPFYSPYKWSCMEHELSFPQREFIEKYISKIDVPPPFTPDVCESYPADAWIVGSDQVWRPWCSHYIENCFFDFVNTNAKRIAYAASFGTDQWELSSEMTYRLKLLASKFDAISVRELSGKKLCKEHFNIWATQVLDPTLLLSADDYLKLTTDDDYPKEDYIAGYILDVNSHKTLILKKLSHELGLPVKNIGIMHSDRYDSIEEWLSTLAHARYVVTDSFHGTVFSFIFKRPVKILNNDLRGNSRLSSLLNTLKVEDTDFFTMNKYNLDILEQLKYKSIDFLKNSLS